MEKAAWNDSFRNSATSPFQTQNGAGDGGGAGSGNRGNGNEQRALHELDDLAFGGAGCNFSDSGRNLDRSVHDLPFKEGYVRKLM